MVLSSVLVKWKDFRWYHWLFAGLILIYVTYIAVSYLYLPGKLRQVAQEDIAELIGRPIHVGQIAFNPLNFWFTDFPISIETN